MIFIFVNNIFLFKKNKIPLLGLFLICGYLSLNFQSYIHTMIKSHNLILILTKSLC